jgi:hypothetical protein
MEVKHQPPLASSNLLYRIVGIARDRSRAVLMTGMPLDEANAARKALYGERQYAWVQVERETE